MPAFLRYAVTVFVLFSLLSFGCAGKDVVRNDEVDSFQLVVTAVGSTANTSVQSALLKGMLLGLEGRRSVRASRGRRVIHLRAAQVLRCVNMLWRSLKSLAMRKRSQVLWRVFKIRVAAAQRCSTRVCCSSSRTKSTTAQSAHR